MAAGATASGAGAPAGASLLGVAKKLKVAEQGLEAAAQGVGAFDKLLDAVDGTFDLIDNSLLKATEDANKDQVEYESWGYQYAEQFTEAENIVKEFKEKALISEKEHANTDAEGLDHGGKWYSAGVSIYEAQQL